LSDSLNEEGLTVGDTEGADELCYSMLRLSFRWRHGEDESPDLMVPWHGLTHPPLDPLDLGEIITDRFTTTGKDIGTAHGTVS
jgi:hypothetical protein